MKLKLVDRFENGANITSFIFKPEEKLSFKPGQFLHYKIPNPHPDDRGENRFFSISSAPFEDEIRLTTKFALEKSSTFKKDLQKFQVGDFIEASIPKGSFSLDDNAREYVFIAGGMGITPFRSILLDLEQRKKPLNITLIYGNRDSEILFKEELELLARKHSEFKIFYILSEEKVEEHQIADNIKVISGKIDEDLIRKLVPDLKKPMYYISGPEGMVVTLEEVIWDMGIPKDQTKRDYYPGYEQY